MSVYLDMEFPFPPSQNTYYRNARRTVVSAKGRAYVDQVNSIVIMSEWEHKIDYKVFVECQLYPPDARRRDADNFLKVWQDAGTKAGVWNDDSLIKKMLMSMEPPMRPHGCVMLRVWPLNRVKITIEEVPLFI